MKPNVLSIVLSLPHAGETVPDEVRDINRLSLTDIRLDGDEGSMEIYDFKDRVSHYITTDVARAFVDMNRAPNDIRLDGVVKTHTCQNVPIYTETLGADRILSLIHHYHAPYHRALKRACRSQVLFGVDGHTMLESAPPTSAHAGEKRPWVCLSNGQNNQTCPDHWLVTLAALFEKHLGKGRIGLNTPFQGGYIVKTHGQNLPWFQLELSREPFAGTHEKKQMVLSVLSDFTEKLTRS